MKGQTIQLGGWDPTKCEECIINGTPKPGQLAILKGSTASQGGRFTYGIRNLPNGTFGPIAVFVEAGPMWDYTHNYANGDRGFIRWLTPGEFVNIWVDVPGTGTGTIYNIGQLYEPDSAGNIVGQGITASTQNIFQGLEAVVDPGNVLTTQLTFVQRCW